MSIFSRSANTPQQTATAPSPEPGAQVANSEQAADQTSPFAPPRNAAPGVVPPPAAPVYSMRPAESERRVDTVADGSMAESARLALKAKARLAPQRAKPAAAPAQARIRQMQQAACAPAAPPASARQQFDPLRAAQTGLLKLAWSWQKAGSPIRAIHTYMELIYRYPDSAAASAAVADLVELSDTLACEGQFHTALSIYEYLEHCGTVEELA